MTKRALDITLLILLSAPAGVLSLFAAAIILLRDGRPILFTQLRTGLHDRPFKLYKFRSMSNAVDSRGVLLPDLARLTRWGVFLRASSLDELPQLWNVLRGDMSLVGPRPLPVMYVPRYSRWQRRRHLVTPGITGWAQIHGRNAITWQEKFELDVWYVDHANLLLDLKILCLTVLRVIRRDGIAQEGEATMPEFLGGDPEDYRK